MLFFDVSTAFLPIVVVIESIAYVELTSLLLLIFVWRLCSFASLGTYLLALSQFQDCNWGDHCTRVSERYGVVSQQTPRGLRWEEFLQAMAKFEKQATK